MITAKYKITGLDYYIRNNNGRSMVFVTACRIEHEGLGRGHKSTKRVFTLADLCKAAADCYTGQTDPLYAFQSTGFVGFEHPDYKELCAVCNPELVPYNLRNAALDAFDDLDKRKNPPLRLMSALDAIACLFVEVEHKLYPERF